MITTSSVCDHKALNGSARYVRRPRSSRISRDGYGGIPDCSLKMCLGPQVRRAWWRLPCRYPWAAGRPIRWVLLPDRPLTPADRRQRPVRAVGTGPIRTTTPAPARSVVAGGGGARAPVTPGSIRLLRRSLASLREARDEMTRSVHTVGQENREFPALTGRSARNGHGGLLVPNYRN